MDGGPGGIRGGGFAPNGQNDQGQLPPGQNSPGQAPPGQATSGRRQLPSLPGGQLDRQPGGGAMGGLLNGTSVSTELKQLLTSNADAYTWVAATARAQNAASYQLATEQPVMAIGGFNGTANSPTLAQFKTYVAEGRIHYFIAAGSGEGQLSGTGSQDSASQIQSWVTKNFTAKTVDGVTLYDLTQGR
jgi:hypothetical protein